MQIDLSKLLTPLSDEQIETLREVQSDIPQLEEALDTAERLGADTTQLRATLETMKHTIAVLLELHRG